MQQCIQEDHGPLDNTQDLAQLKNQTSSIEPILLRDSKVYQLLSTWPHTEAMIQIMKGYLETLGWQVWQLTQ